MSPYEAPRRAGIARSDLARGKFSFAALAQYLNKDAIRQPLARMKRFIPPRWVLIGGFYLLLAVWILPPLLAIFSGKSLHDMANTLRMLGGPSLARAMACVIGTYAVMCVMEVLALRDARYGWLGFRSMIVPLLANSVSMGTGFGAVSGAGLRVRLYDRWKIDPGNSLFVASSVTVMSVAGGAFIAACGLVQSPQMIADSLDVSPVALQVFGALIFGAFLLGLGLAGDEPRLFTLAGRSFRAPRASGWAGRIGAGAVDWLFSAAALYLLLPPHLPIGFLSFAALFAAIHLAAMATGVPGGIGVFDAIMLRLRPESVPIGEMAAALIAYRLIAFVTPSLLGTLGLAAYEAHGFGTKAARERLEEIGARLAHWGAQTWAGWIEPSVRTAPRPRVAGSVGDLFSAAHNRRPISLQALTRGGPVLVIAPHPDDETLGCGGLISACAAHGIPVHVVILTDGGRSHRGSQSWTASRLAARRAGEARIAVTHLGLGQRDLSLFKFGDGALLFSQPLRRTALAALTRVAAKTRARTVFTTWPHDPHPDHISAAMLAAQLQKRMPRIRLVHYPIWGRFLPRDMKIRDRAWRAVKLDVRAYRAAKRQALCAYRSQTTTLISDASIDHRLTDAHTRTFLGPDETFLI